MANEQIQHAEEQQLAAAMEASANEQELVAAQELPLIDRAEDELRARYCASTMLHKLDGTALRHSLFQEPLRSAWVQLLEFERQYSKLWYPNPGTTRYFNELGDSLLQRAENCLASATSASESTTRQPESLIADKRQNKRQRVPQAPLTAAKSHRGKSQRQMIIVDEGNEQAGISGGAAQVTPSLNAQCNAAHIQSAADQTAAESQAHAMPPPGVAAAWCRDVANEVQRIQEHTAWMPSSNGEVPPFLSSYILQNEGVVFLE